jgi:hypothetical protein
VAPIERSLTEIRDWAQLASSLVAVVMTIIIYRVTRSISQTEATREIASMWQEFNKVMLDGENAALFNGYFGADTGELASNSRLEYLVMMFLNCLYTEFVNGRRNFITRGHYKSTMRSHSKFLFARRGEILELMRGMGYDLDFIKFMSDSFDEQRRSEEKLEHAV